MGMALPVLGLANGPHEYRGYILTMKGGRCEEIQRGEQRVSIDRELFFGSVMMRVARIHVPYPELNERVVELFNPRQRRAITVAIWEVRLH